MATLLWDNENRTFHAEIEQGTLYVWGDYLFDREHDGNWAVAKRLHPEMTDEQIEAFLETEEGGKIQQATNEEFMDAEGWVADADIIDDGDEGDRRVFIIRKKGWQGVPPKIQKQFPIGTKVYALNPETNEVEIATVMGYHSDEKDVIAGVNVSFGNPETFEFDAGSPLIQRI